MQVWLVPLLSITRGYRTSMVLSMMNHGCMITHDPITPKCRFFGHCYGGWGYRLWRLQTQTINFIFTDLLPISPTNKKKFKISLGSTYMYALIFSHRILFLPMFILRCLLIHSTDFIEHLLCVRSHYMC